MTLVTATVILYMYLFGTTYAIYECEEIWEDNGVQLENCQRLGTIQEEAICERGESPVDPRRGV